MEVLLDEHMSWNEQIYQVKLKLNHTSGILSKLCSHANLNTLRIAYYSLNLICNMAYNYGARKRGTLRVKIGHVPSLPHPAELPMG